MGKYKAIYLGAVGNPRLLLGILEQCVVIRIRAYFDKFINLRPGKL